MTGNFRDWRAVNKIPGNAPCGGINSSKGMQLPKPNKNCLHWFKDDSFHSKVEEETNVRR